MKYLVYAICGGIGWFVFNDEGLKEFILKLGTAGLGALMVGLGTNDIVKKYSTNL